MEGDSRADEPAPGITVAYPSKSNPLDLLDGLIARARAAGADAADAVLFDGTSLSATQRLGAREEVVRSESLDIGLRTFLGKRQAIVSSSDTSATALTELVERALAMARAAPEDPHCGLAATELLATKLRDLDLYDDAEPSVEALFERAAQAEDAARAVPGVTNSEGAGASWGTTTATLVASNGFSGSYTASRHSVDAAVLAGTGTEMEGDYDYATARFAADLEDSAAIGRAAGERAVRRLHPRKAATAKVPVVYEPRAGASLLRHLAGAIAGPAVARGTSFLRDKMGTAIFASGLTVVDDPHRPRGLASRPCDGEGVANRRATIVENGVLTTWLLDTNSAHQLGLTSTGHASRGTSAPPVPSPTNLYLEPGTLTPTELMADIASGFYVSELMGFGVNPITGDYSRAAAGFWIDNGAIAHPVSELTIAGNLVDMMLNLTPADDLEFRRGVDTPTVRIDGMTVAGA